MYLFPLVEVSGTNLYLAIASILIGPVVIAALITGWMNRDKTDAEVYKFTSEADYNYAKNLRESLADMITRVERLERREKALTRRLDTWSKAWKKVMLWRADPRVIALEKEHPLDVDFESLLFDTAEDE